METLSLDFQAKGLVVSHVSTLKTSKNIAPAASQKDDLRWPSSQHNMQKNPHGAEISRQSSLRTSDSIGPAEGLNQFPAQETMVHESPLKGFQKIRPAMPHEVQLQLRTSLPSG